MRTGEVYPQERWDPLTARRDVYIDELTIVAAELDPSPPPLDCSHRGAGGGWVCCGLLCCCRAFAIAQAAAQRAADLYVYECGAKTRKKNPKQMPQRLGEI